MEDNTLKLYVDPELMVDATFDYLKKYEAAERHDIKVEIFNAFTAGAMFAMKNAKITS